MKFKFNLKKFLAKSSDPKNEKYRIKVTELNSGLKSFMPQYYGGSLLDQWTDLIILETDNEEFAGNVIVEYKKRLALHRSLMIKNESFIPVGVIAKAEDEKVELEAA